MRETFYNETSKKESHYIKEKQTNYIAGGVGTMNGHGKKNMPGAAGEERGGKNYLEEGGSKLR